VTANKFTLLNSSILYLIALLVNMAGSNAGLWEVKQEFRGTKI
jgi:hypothetical protein